MYYNIICPISNRCRDYETSRLFIQNHVYQENYIIKNKTDITYYIIYVTQ